MSDKKNNNSTIDYIGYGMMGAILVVGVTNLVLLWRNGGKLDNNQAKLLSDAASSIADAAKGFN